MFGTSLHSTYKGHKIYVNGFGEYEVTLGGVAHAGIRTLTEARHMISVQVAKEAVINDAHNRNA